MLVHLRHAEAVRDGPGRHDATLPAHLRGSLTWDQGCGKWPATSNSRWPPTCPSTSATRPADGTNGASGLLRQYF